VVLSLFALGFTALTYFRGQPEKKNTLEQLQINTPVKSDSNNQKLKKIK
jgi:hypothetical protein